MVFSPSLPLVFLVLVIFDRFMTKLQQALNDGVMENNVFDLCFLFLPFSSFFFSSFSTF